MIRHDYYYKQRVTESELDEGFDYAEQADRAMIADADAHGIYSGFGVSQQSVADLTVKVDTGVAYDQRGQRCSLATLTNLDCSVDHLSVSTAVASPGNEKWISLFVEFNRVLSDPRTDGLSSTVYFLRTESVTLWVKQGAEAAIGAATKPALESNAILLADILLTNGMTQIKDDDISTTRTEWLVNSTTNGYSLTGNFRTVLSQLLGYVAALGTGTDHIPATAIDYAGGSAWYDSETNPAASVEAQLDKIVVDLIATAASHSGAHRLGCAARTAWLGSRANAATSVYGAIDKIITDLAAVTASDDGAERIGAAASAGTPYSLSESSVRTQLGELQTALNGHVSAGASDIHIVKYGVMQTDGTLNIVSAGDATGWSTHEDMGYGVAVTLLASDTVFIWSSGYYGGTAMKHRLVAKKGSDAPVAIPGTTDSATVTGKSTDIGYYVIPSNGDYKFFLEAEKIGAGDAHDVTNPSFYFVAIR